MQCPKCSQWMIRISERWHPTGHYRIYTYQCTHCYYRKEVSA